MAAACNKVPYVYGSFCLGNPCLFNGVVYHWSIAGIGGLMAEDKAVGMKRRQLKDLRERLRQALDLLNNTTHNVDLGCS